MNKFVTGMNKNIAPTEQINEMIYLDHEQQRDHAASSRRHKLRVRLVSGTLFLIVLLSLGLLYSGTPSGSVKLQVWREKLSTATSPAEVAPQQVHPEISFPFESYSMTDNRAPGFPLVINVSGAEEIRLSSTSGGFVGWNPPDYTVNPLGKEISLATGETAYWTPLIEDQTQEAITGSELSMSAYRGGKLISQALIQIQSDASGIFTGKWAEGD